MASNMKSFTNDIESRLDKLYKNGASSKFGFNDVVEGSKKIVSKDEKEKEINKIASQAQAFLNKNTTKKTSDGSKALVPKMKKK